MTNAQLLCATAHHVGQVRSLLKGYCSVLFIFNFLLGKTTTLKAIKAMFGDNSGIQRGKVSPEALIKLSSMTSFPVPIDDVSSALTSEAISVVFFNAACHTTVSGGTRNPLGTVIFSSNKSFIESER